jgi:hypothetical protein
VENKMPHKYFNCSDGGSVSGYQGYLFGLLPCRNEHGKAAEKGLILDGKPEKYTSGAEAHMRFERFTARLKSSPFKAAPHQQ